MQVKPIWSCGLKSGTTECVTKTFEGSKELIENIDIQNGLN